MTYIVGQVIRVKDQITDPDTGTLTDDASVTVTVYKPDETVVSPAPSLAHPSTGTYTAQFTVDQAGWWQYIFSSTLTAPGAGRKKFYVSPVP
jgi:hypothetical protein